MRLRLPPLAAPNATETTIRTGIDSFHGSHMPRTVTKYKAMVTMMTLKQPNLSARRPGRNRPTAEPAPRKKKKRKLSEAEIP